MLVRATRAGRLRYATDVFHADTVRGAVGTLFHLPVAECATTEALPWLRRHGVGDRRRRLPPRTAPYWEADLSGSVALVVGSERHGVSTAWLDAADRTVAIPMPGPSDSLNVAVAAGIVLFEAVRQRTGRSVSQTRSGSAA